MINLSGATSSNSQKEDSYHWVYVEFASRRAHRNNVDAQHNFFLVDVRCWRFNFCKLKIA